MRAALWAGARWLAPLVVLGGLVWRLGTGPFLDGVRMVDGGVLAVAAGIAVLTTAGAAWRWTLVARGLGVDLTLRAAMIAYYRSQFLNVTLPGGVVGDVHRGVRHGRDRGDVGRGLRAVVWERCAGQVVQIVVTVVALLALPSPVQSSMPLVVLVVALSTVALVAGWGLARDRSRPARIRRAVAGDVRDALIAGRAWVGIALASGVVLSGHAITFLIAARAAGVVASPAQMLPIALLVMLAMTLPSVAGWGPREGVSAWVFGAAGLGAQRGVSAAVIYGVMVFVATAPGAVVLVVASLRGNRESARDRPPLREEPVHA